MRPDLFPLWGEAFLITIALELPIYLFGTWRMGPWPLLVAVSVALSAVTHPLLWMVFSALGSWVYVNYTLFLLIAEVLVSLSEGVMLKAVLGVSWRRALLTAAAANAFSAGVGPYVWRWLGSI